MHDIRDSYAYRLLQSINQNSLGALVQPDQADISLREANKYHILDDVYGIIKTDYLRQSDVSDADLVYAATE